MKNVFVHTQNVKNFIGVLHEAEKSAGEPCLLVFHGQAGRGKTSAAQFFAAQEGWTYCRALKGWTELWMLQDLCFELQIDPVPKRKKAAFEAIRDVLHREPRTVLVDEADKLSDALIEWVRDLADVTFCPFALVGEKLILHKMKRERRIWSRTLRAVEFGPITTKDILFFAKESGGMAITADQGELIRDASEGDFRLVKRDLGSLEEIIKANPGNAVTDEMVKLAIKRGFRGN